MSKSTLATTYRLFTRESRMLHASLSGRPSVCPSVTLVICIKTVQARVAAFEGSVDVVSIANRKRH